MMAAWGEPRTREHWKNQDARPHIQSDILHVCSQWCQRHAAGGAFALFSLLKRQAAVDTGGKHAALDRSLRQYSTGAVQTRAGATSSRSLRARASSSRSQGTSQSPGRAGTSALHDWRQRLIAVGDAWLTGSTFASN